MLYIFWFWVFWNIFCTYKILQIKIYFISDRQTINRTIFNEILWTFIDCFMHFEFIYSFFCFAEVNAISKFYWHLRWFEIGNIYFKKIELKVLRNVHTPSNGSKWLWCVLKFYKHRPDCLRYNSKISHVHLLVTFGIIYLSFSI